ncbi:hypothetical protein [Paenibacillus campi]|uniref:PIN/TRAM domain-containing protein n=1 Tax=Paenibacillus campi TaxID=3106031 RepID=UPI002AFFD167|nr:hypothetical protein [Paenibacillus sp. SGZ-1014]
MLDQLWQWNTVIWDGEQTPLHTFSELAFILMAVLLLSLLLRYVLIMLEKWRLHVLTMPINSVIVGLCGLSFGLVLGWLGAIMISWWEPIYEAVRTFLMLTLGYLGLRIGYERAGELMPTMLMQVTAGADGQGRCQRDQQLNGEHTDMLQPSMTAAEQTVLAALPTISVLDANIAIDGRIESMIECGFIGGVVIVPDFIVQELQLIADSADTLRRQRGRKGLDTLTRLHTLPGIELELATTHYSDKLSADERLVQLAAARKAVLLTHDRNLEQIAGLHSIRVLSINRLAARLKPPLLAGELLQVQITRVGKEAGQGVAHLDDGTMIVVEQGRAYMNRELEVIITSVLQTASGRMIFARPYDSATGQ